MRIIDMRRLNQGICSLIAVLGLTVAVASSQAAVWAPTLSFDGVIDEYKDNSRAQVADINGNLIVDAGDIIYGVLRIGDKIAPVSEGLNFPVDQQLVAVFSFRIKSATPGAFSMQVLEPVPHTDPLSLYGLATGNAAFQALLPLADWDKSILAILEKAPSTADPTLQNAPSATVISDVIGATAVGWTTDMIAGIVSLTDFLQGVITTDSIPVLAAATSPTPLGQEAGGLSVQYEAIGATGFLSVPITHLDLVTVTSHDLTFSANVLGFDNTGAADLTDWVTQDNANFRINPTGVPEPASVAAWSLLGLAVGCGTVWRRRRK